MPNRPVQPATRRSALAATRRSALAATRRSALAAALAFGGGALSSRPADAWPAATPPVLAPPPPSPVDVVMNLHPEVGYDGPDFVAALCDVLGWTDGKGRRVMKAALHDYCIQPQERHGVESWLGFLRTEVARAQTDGEYDTCPDVDERARIGKSAGISTASYIDGYWVMQT